MGLPTFSITEIVDRYVQENFQRLKDFLSAETTLLGFRGYELQFTTIDPHYKFKHNLGYLPKDVFLTSQKGSGTAVQNSSLATATDLDFTITGTVTPQTPLTIRFLAGTFDSGS